MRELGSAVKGKFIVICAVCGRRISHPPHLQEHVASIQAPFPVLASHLTARLRSHKGQRNFQDNGALPLPRA